VEVKLELTGAGLTKPMTFTFDQLASRQMTELDDVLMLKTHSDDEMTSWRGPSLESLLAEAGLKPGAMNVTLTAEDGYEVDTKLDELADAVVALKNGEGRWVAEVEEGCQLKLVPPHMPGNFWIINICRIKVEPV
jgi:DMSO/TMAO reductase YedYZ molybdopterin-dependent catalytic subunit